MVGGHTCLSVVCFGRGVRGLAEKQAAEEQDV